MNAQRTALGAAIVGALVQGAIAQFSFNAGIGYPAPERPDGVAAADFNGDGFADLAVATETPNKVSFLFNNGDGTFAAPVNVLTGGGTGPGFVAVGDFDGDGDFDVAVALKNIGVVRVLVNTGGTFSAGSNTTVGDEPRWIATGDLDGDGDLDMAVINRGDDSMTVLLNDGTGSFTTSTVAVGADPRSVALGDFDRDGDSDAAVANHDDRTIGIFANNGTGGLTLAATLSVGAQLRPDGLVASDLTGDGHTDLAAATSGNGLNFASVFVNTAGGLTGPANYAIGGANPVSIAVGDLDSDGDADLATVNQDSANVSLLANNGTGAFGASMQLAVGATPQHLAMHDLTGNGTPDIAVSNRDSNSVTVLLNAAAPPCPADFNGDTVVNSLDVLAFLNAYTSGDPSADVNGDTVINSLDAIAFLNLYNTGCA